jgi:hypothetical protein
MENVHYVSDHESPVANQVIDLTVQLEVIAQRSLKFGASQCIHLTLTKISS